MVKPILNLGIPHILIGKLGSKNKYGQENVSDILKGIFLGNYINEQKQKVCCKVPYLIDNGILKSTH